jgi:hypothetical protein
VTKTCRESEGGLTDQLRLPPSAPDHLPPTSPEELVDIRVAQLPVAVHEVVAAELVDAGNFNDSVPSATEVGVDDKIAATSLALRADGVVALCGQARVMADLLQRIQDRLVGILCAAWFSQVWI